MRYIREVSDTHLDHDIDMWHHGPLKHSLDHDMDMLWYPEPMVGDDDTCLILSGDIWSERRFLTRKHPVTEKTWIEEVAAMFKYVVFVLGNHDYWNQNLHHEPGKVRETLNKLGLKNVFFLERDTIVLDQVKFVGGTLWTDFNDFDTATMRAAANKMNDYRYIRAGQGYRSLHSADVAATHVKTRDYIFANATRDNPDQKVIVVTHHPPSPQSYHDYHGPGYEGYYVSNLESWITEEGVTIDLWFHGHVHIPSRYMVGATEVIAHPRGYAGARETGYDPYFRIEL